MRGTSIEEEVGYRTDENVIRFPLLSREGETTSDARVFAIRRCEEQERILPRFSHDENIAAGPPTGMVKSTLSKPRESCAHGTTESRNLVGKRVSSVSLSALLVTAERD